MLYAKSDDLRRRMLLESNDVAYPANLAVLQRTVETRAELARTLGFKDWAAFDLSNRMAATPQNAAAFIDRIVAASAAKANADYQLILDRKKQDQPGATIVDAWERRYYTELVRQSSYDFDSQSMRPYLAYERVRAGVFAVDRPAVRPRVPAGAGTAGVAPVGRARTRCSRAAAWSARIYLDMHPRAGKGGGGATAATARAGIRGRQIPEVVLICRFPGGEPGDPGLMTFDQVTTFFHEFGHLVHAIVVGTAAAVDRPDARGRARLHRSAVADDGRVGVGSGDARHVRDALPDQRADSGRAGPPDAPRQRAGTRLRHAPADGVRRPQPVAARSRSEDRRRDGDLQGPDGEVPADGLSRRHRTSRARSRSCRTRTTRRRTTPTCGRW